MRWQEFARLGAVRAFRVVSPPELRGEHWFEVQPVKDGTVLRHTIDGEVFGEYEAICDCVEPLRLTGIGNRPGPPFAVCHILGAPHGRDRSDLGR
jgi:hypothetical protein